MAAMPLCGASYYTVRLDDPKAIYLTREGFPVHGDGAGDDTEALQQAIDRVQETSGQGIVFVPEGRYRLSRTINVWPGIRLIGYGATRPVLVLGDNTPGYQDPDHEKLMVFFAGGRRGGQIQDAGAGTFYSALSNIDLEIGAGNAGAVGVRAHYAQHCFLAHMDIHIGSGLAGIHEGGNVVEDVHFYGGRYGVWTRTPSPGWQFTLVDATFEGQREAAIQERAAGLTLIRPQFRNVPTAIAIDPDSPDDLWVKDARMENISGPAVIVSLENSARNQINMENVVCSRVPVFALMRESGRKVAAPGPVYDVKVFSHGLHFADLDAVAENREIFEASPIGALPAPGGLRPARPAGARYLGEHPFAGGQGRWGYGRYGGVPEGHCRPPCDLSAGRQVRSERHDRSAAGYRPDRAAPQRYPDRSAGWHAGLSRRGRTEGAAGSAAGRQQHRDRDRAVHQRHQSAGGGGEVDGGRQFHDERRALSGRARHQPAGRQPRQSLQQHAHRRPGACAGGGTGSIPACG